MTSAVAIGGTTLPETKHAMQDQLEISNNSFGVILHVFAKSFCSPSIRPEP